MTTAPCSSDRKMLGSATLYKCYPSPRAQAWLAGNAPDSDDESDQEQWEVGGNWEHESGSHAMLHQIQEGCDCKNLTEIGGRQQQWGARRCTCEGSCMSG
eukprot:scaffold220664_cov14-Tisochrysis_lutea.AAC.1